MASRDIRTATWVEDGIFWPPTSVATEMRTEQGLLFVPNEGLETYAQFFVVRVAEALHAVIGAIENVDREVVRAAVRARHPTAGCTFIERDRSGYAEVTCEGALTDTAATAVAIVRHSASWDESEVIVVTDGVVRFGARITYVKGVFSATTALVSPNG